MMADMEESTTEVAVTYPEVSTLPAIRPLAQEALAKLGLAVEVRRQEEARLERERQESLRPQREAVADWAQAALDAMPSTPKIEDPDIMDAMRRHVERARMALLDLRERMTAEPTN